MSGTVADPDVAALVSSATAIQAAYMAEDADWAGSPFAWIKARPSRQVGKIGELLIDSWLTAKGFTVGRSPDSQADRVINGRRSEIKFSTRWKTGLYCFQQLRDQDYDFVLCLGVSPFDAHCWVLPKAEIVMRWKAAVASGRDVDGIGPQHGGVKGRDTYWMRIDPVAPRAWLAPYGGRLALASAVLSELTSADRTPEPP